MTIVAMVVMLVFFISNHLPRWTDCLCLWLVPFTVGDGRAC